MPELEDVRRFLSEETGLATISTTQADGRVLSSIANCGVIDHPLTGAPCVALVSVGGAARLAHVRRGSELREIFRAAGGDHDDFDQYDRAMVENARTAILVSPDRIIGNAPSS